MYTVWMLALSNIRKRKIQNGLTAILIMLATILLTTSIVVILNNENSFEDMHNKTNGSHQLLQFEQGLHDPQIVHQWWKEQDGVKVSELIRYRNLSRTVYKDKEIPNLYAHMMETPNVPFAVDKLIFAQGKERLIPEEGTIWIPTSLAYSNGISIGDNLTFNSGENAFKLKVSAVVVDIPFGAPFTTNARIWMNTQDYRKYVQSMQGKDMYMMGLRFDHYDQNVKEWSNFEKFLGTAYVELKTEFEGISSFYLIINKIIGFIMIFLGIIMIGVALFTIGFTISDAILASYKTIGVLKSLGLSSIKIISTYVAQYAFLTIISIIPGLIFSHFMSRMIVESSLSNLKTEKSQIVIQGTDISFVVGAGVLLIIIAYVLIYANKVRFIQPVQAIKYGMSELENSKMTSRFSLTKSNGSKYSVVFMIGLRNILKNIKGSALMIILTMITSAVLVFGFTLINSIISLQQTAPLWGYDSSNIAGTIFNKEVFSKKDLERDLLHDKRVKNIGWFSQKNGTIPPRDQNMESMNISINIIEGNYDELGFAVLKGKNPRNKNEIALGINVAKKFNKDVGDILELYIDGKRQSFTITGIYQAISNMSNSVRIKSDVITAYLPDYSDVGTCYINLKDNKEADRFVNELNMKYKKFLTVYTQQTLLDTVFKEAISVLIIPMSMMCLLFIAVTFIIIYSICRINIRKESKTYGIYKSIGMTSNRIKASVTGGIAVLSATGSFFGIFAGIYVLPIVLEGTLSNYGIVHFPLVLNWSGIILFSVVSVLSAVLGSWVSSKIINKTSPRILVTD
ncbi:FtsX-like permease family protein [Metabacillus fastidiosus]|uniref:FtsX-like permease family protein n=1 Tax=Metabacillus fastidiosus TaxID=1458 RepID=A0ABU6NXY3_9BACI|nr:FtsX-like permease family protein [Metabacillus fastidiosus]MED4401984.1 FtsX-like permease family protein [Metabacillus fastidiosus]